MITNEQMGRLNDMWHNMDLDDYDLACIKAAISTLERLPQYEDTKARFVPGVDECWCVVKCLGAWKIAIREAVPSGDGWGVGACEYDEDCIEAFYSNAAAALAVLAAQRKDGE